MRFLVLAISLFSTTAMAGVQAFNSTTNLGLFNQIKCSTGLTCSNSAGKLNIVTNGSVSGVITPSSGIAVSSGAFKNFGRTLAALTTGTSTTPVTTTVFLTQIYVPSNATLTGIKINNGATVGTDKYIVALFNSSGTAVANSALAGTTTSGADSFQTIPFTSTYAAVGPAVYWIALYVNGVTDRFRTLPALAEGGGLAGSVTGQVFGTVAAITVPTTFTADKGPVAFTY